MDALTSMEAMRFKIKALKEVIKEERRVTSGGDRRLRLRLPSHSYSRVLVMHKR